MIEPGVLLLVGAGFLAGVVNTIAGAGSLLTFPALLAAGLPPLAANVTNCVGVIPGSLSGAYGLRGQLTGRWRPAIGLAAWAGAGSLLGATLLLQLPGGAFERVVVVLVGGAGLLVLAQPLVSRRIAARRASRPSVAPRRGLLGPVVGATGVYGGYFGAAQGVLLIAVLGVGTDEPLARVNATKNVIAVAANGVAGLVYAFVAPVDWSAALAVGVGALCGGPVGAVLAQRVPAGPLRLGIALVSFVVAVRLGLGAF